MLFPRLEQEIKEKYHWPIVNVLRKIDTHTRFAYIGVLKKKKKMCGNESNLVSSGAISCENHFLEAISAIHVYMLPLAFAIFCNEKKEEEEEVARKNQYNIRALVS